MTMTRKQSYNSNSNLYELDQKGTIKEQEKKEAKKAAMAQIMAEETQELFKNMPSEDSLMPPKSSEAKLSGSVMPPKFSETKPSGFVNKKLLLVAGLCLFVALLRPVSVLIDTLSCLARFTLAWLTIDV